MTSRAELLAWVNDLLQINYTKVEQCGTGGAYCQIIDSIYLDIPMTRVKMNAKHEYEFTANYKVLQNVFKTHKIDKPIPVQALVKCKMQDNLEFLQWIKRFWDQNYPGHPYDPVARRKGAPVDTPATVAPLATGGSRGALSATSAAGRSGGRTPIGGHRAGSTQPTDSVVVQQLRAQVEEMNGHLEGLEKERDFYFEKLREIEILVQEMLEATPEENQDPTLKKIQAILYSTEEGFEAPVGEADAEDEMF